MQILSMSELLSQLKQNEIEYGPQTVIDPKLMTEFAEVVNRVREATDLVAQLAAAHAYIQALAPVLQAKIRLQYSLPIDAPINLDLDLGVFQVGTKKATAATPPDWVDEVLKAEDTPSTLM